MTQCKAQRDAVQSAGIRTLQGWEFNLSIFDLLIFSIFKKDGPWSNRSRQSLIKIECDRIALVNHLKRLNPSLAVFDSFLPFYSKRSNRSRQSLIFDFFKRLTGSIRSKDRWERFDLLKDRIVLSITKNDRFQWKSDDRMNSQPWIPVWMRITLSQVRVLYTLFVVDRTEYCELYWPLCNPLT